MLLSLLQLPARPSTWESITASLNSPDFWFRVVVVLFCAPIWFPILRRLYREIDRSLRAEGGVFAREYTPRELALLEKDEEPRDMPFKSVPRLDPAARAARARDRGTAHRPRAAAQPTGRVARPSGSGGSTGRAIHSRRARGF